MNLKISRLALVFRRQIHSPAGHGTANPSEIAHFSRLSSQWWDEQGEFVFLHRMNPVRVQFIQQKLLEIAREQDGESSTPPKFLHGLDILDVGCGGGLLSEVRESFPRLEFDLNVTYQSLSRLGANTLGIDASESNIEIARLHASADPKLSQLSYLHGTAESLLESPKRYDVVCSMEVLEHVDNPASFLSLCAELLKVGFLSLTLHAPG